MKRICLIFSLIFLSQVASSQCQVTSNTGTNLSNQLSMRMGQAFVGECDGFLQFVQFFANETGVMSDGTLYLYSGNTVTDEPIYTQEYSSFTIENPGDPIRINLAEAFTITENSQYTFEFKITGGIDFLGTNTDVYSGGSAFQNGIEFSSADIDFSVSVTSSFLNVDDFNENKNVRLFPNPSSDFIQISGLFQNETYSIYTILGSQVATGNISNDEKINIENFKRGVYFLTFGNGNAIKFIKE